jgi:hypothetical protein
MASEPQQAPSAQTAATKFIVFQDFEKMNTRPARIAVSEKESYWQENLQPIAPNNLQVVPAPLPAISTLPAGTVLSIFWATLGLTDFAIVFTTTGAAYQISLANGVQTLMAPAGTFSAPDMTVYASQVILIADGEAGYCAWNGFTLSQPGGVSPHIIVTAGGSGYSTAPLVTITGGHGIGATAFATVSGGSVISVILATQGRGFLPGDTLTVAFGGPGTGATATAILWPTISCTTLAVFAGRVWLGSGRVLEWTGTNGYDDTDPANAAGSTVISDADLSHEITALRNLDNYLFIFGDSSIRQIGSISVSSGVTLFTPLTLTSDVGTLFPLTIQSYNRLVVFANKQGVWAIFGASVEKISDDLDGIFSGSGGSPANHSNIDFSLTPSAALNDIRNIHCYLLLVQYIDPVEGNRSIILTLQEKKWFICDQGSNLLAIASAPLLSTGQIETFGSSGSDITQLLQDSTTAQPFKLITGLSPHGNYLQAKGVIRAGVSATVEGVGVFDLEIDTENGADTYPLSGAPQVTWLNDGGGVVTWTNSSGGVVTFCGAGFVFPYTKANGYGKFLGATVTGTQASFALNAVAIEYHEKSLWGTPQ